MFRLLAAKRRDFRHHWLRIMLRPGCSIVITCYNLESYIAASIRSVLDQDAPDDVEIIVVDDCSTDDSAAAIQAFPTVRYERTPTNSGVLLAMLQGIEAASHDIVFLLDGDDLWEPEKLRLCRNAFAQDPALGLLTHDLSFIDGDDAPIARNSRPAAVLGPIAPADRSEAVRQGILGLTDYIWLGSALGLRRSATDFAGFAAWVRERPDPRNIYQDWPLAYWAAAQADLRVGYVDAKLFRYRLHGANHSGDARSVDKALRNVRRTLNTTETLHAIACKKNVAARYRRVVARYVRFCRYQVVLYQDRRLAAIGRFAPALPFLMPRPRWFAKEVARLALISTMGLRRFVAWQASRSA